MQARNTSLVIVGAGGHARVVADAALLAGGWSQVRATEPSAAEAGEFLPGVLMLPWAELPRTACCVHVGIGDPAARERESATWKERLAAIVHPHASVSRFSDIADGAFIAAQAVVAPRARVGVSAIVNHGAVVDHDCSVGDYSHIAPGATLGGAASVGVRVLLGAGARLLPRVAVCADVTIGAGAVVTESISLPGVYAGVPARRLR